MIGRMILCLALVSGVGAASAQEAACTLYKVNASVLTISKDAGGGGNIGALEDGDIACVTRQQAIDGGDWGFVSHKLEKPSGRTPVNGWATLRYMEKLSLAEAAAIKDMPPPPPVAAAAPPPAGAAAPRPAAAGGDADASIYQRVSAWAHANTTAVAAIGASFTLAAIGFLFLAVRRRPAARASAASTDKATRLLEPEIQPVVYGWLEMLDGHTARYPLGCTNVRIGRDQDNDVRLQNDSISRQHALLYFNSDKRRFVITDLGAANGMMVNKVRQTKHELSDGDLVQLGEVRMRFRANTKLPG